MKNLRGAAAKAPGTEPAKNGSLAPAGLVLATPGETFYGQVRRCLGDRRFVVDNVATGCMVPCRLKGSMGRQWVRAEDWVLVSMRAYESDNEYNERKGEIMLRYESHQVRQLSKAGLLPQRALESDGANVEFVECIGQDQCNGGDDDSETGRPDEDEGDQGDVPVFAAARAVCAREEDLPSPSTTTKSRRSSRKSSDSLVLDIDFHHPTTGHFRPGASIPVAASTPARGPTPHPCPPPAPHVVTIQAVVKFWYEAKGIGYATPQDKRQTKGGVDVRLTVESVEAIKTSLHGHDVEKWWRSKVVEVTIDPRHDRPYALPGGLRVVERAT